MKTRRRKPRFSLVAALFVITVLLSACNDPQRALAPPNADVTGIQTVVIFPFINESTGRDLEQNLVDGLTERLRAVGWYEVIGPERVAPLLSARRIDANDMRPDSARWQETAREIALELEADGFITGMVVQYDENVTVSPAYRGPAPAAANTTAAGGSEGDSDPAITLPVETIQWLVDQSTDVTLVVSGMLVNVHTGVTVYERTVNGSGRITEPRQLNWSVDESPPTTLIPRPHRRDIDSGRSAAIEDALDRFTADILPQRVPEEEGD